MLNLFAELTTYFSKSILLFPFGLSDIDLITINGILHNVHTCAIDAPSISTQSALNSFIISFFKDISWQNTSPVAIFPTFMFMSFINSHDYTSYDQDGNGQNNINKGAQGDAINESTLERND